MCLSFSFGIMKVVCLAASFRQSIRFAVEQKVCSAVLTPRLLFFGLVDRIAFLGNYWF